MNNRAAKVASGGVRAADDEDGVHGHWHASSAASKQNWDVEFSWFRTKLGVHVFLPLETRNPRT